MDRINRHFRSSLSILLCIVFSFSAFAGINKGRRGEIDKRIDLAHSEYQENEPLRKILNKKSEQASLVFYYTYEYSKRLKRFLRRGKGKERKQQIDDLNRSYNKKINGKLKKSGHHEVLAEVSRTYFLIYMLALVEIGRQERVQSNQELRNYNFNKSIGTSLEAAQHLFDSGEMVTSLGGAGLTRSALSQPLKLISYFLERTIQSELGKRILQSMASSLVTFVGWDFAAQLWQEARLLIDIEQLDTEELGLYQESEKLFSHLFHIVSTLDESDPRYIKSRRVLELMIANMFKVLYTDEYRSQWIYNALRHRIGSGHFVTLVSAMSSASAIGSVVFPGAGTVLGMTFGIVGGVTTIFIPETVKQEINWKIGDNRVFVNRANSDILTKAELNKNFNIKGLHLDMELGALSMKDLFFKRQKYRESLIDIYLERVYNNKIQLDRLSGEVSGLVDRLRRNSLRQLTAQEEEYRIDNGLSNEDLRNTLTIMIRELRKEIVHFSERIYSAEFSLITAYANESLFLNELLIANIERFGQGTYNRPVKWINQQRIHVTQMRLHFCSLVSGLQLKNHFPLPETHPNFLKFKKQQEYLKKICPKSDWIVKSGSQRSFTKENEKHYLTASRSLHETYLLGFDEQNALLSRFSAATQVLGAKHPYWMPKF